MKVGVIMRVLLALAVVLSAVPAAPGADATRLAGPIVVGSKKDNEGRLLAEMMAQLLEARGFAVVRKPNLGSTLICFEALRTGEIDLYPEYSGTIEQEILKLTGRVSYPELQKRVKQELNLELLESFGFNNSYAIALSRPLAEKHQIKTISGLARVPGLRYGFSHEFLNRQDGWPGLAKTYGLSAQPIGIAHTLAYPAIQQGKLDVTDVYTTDGDYQEYDLVLLDDDRRFFPLYLAAPLVGPEVDERVKPALGELAGLLSDAKMRSLNAQILVGKKQSIPEVANEFLREAGLLQTGATWSRWSDVPGQVATHLKLTLISLLAAMVVAIPLGVLAYRLPGLARPVLYVAGILQTVPSLALLAFMIPLFGIGTKPAIVALVIYALLPILRNTTAALFSIDPVLKKVSVGMGLTAWQRLRHIELPLAAPNILAGIRTAAVINIGTATLAAFIGAGGLGDRIAIGLDTKNYTLVLEGAALAALLAVFTELAFEAIERLLVPRHLLQKAAE
jgi:osmoprotectant transport system permease protein